MAALIAVSSYTDTSILAHTPKGAEAARGISCFWLDLATGGLTACGGADVGPNPAFLLQSKTSPDVVYASTERIDADGAVFSLRLARRGGGVALEPVDERSAGGKSTCYLAEDASGRWLRLTNYWEASVGVLPVERAALGPCADSHLLPPPAALARADGKRLAPRCAEPAAYCLASNPSREEHWAYRQRWPHAHCVVTEPYDGASHHVVDLGEDAIYHYAFDDAVGKLACRGATRLARGRGPRHVVFHPTAPAAFVVNELESTVSCFAFDGAAALAGGVYDAADPRAAFKLATTASTLPADYDNAHHEVNGIWKAKSHASEIRLDAAGEWLFVGNRGHDSLAVFRVDVAGPEPSVALAHCAPTGGRCPRNFAVLDTHVVLGNQDSNELVVFARDATTGALARVAKTYLASPNYVTVLAAPDAPDGNADTLVAPPPRRRSSNSLLSAFDPPPPPRTDADRPRAATDPTPPARRRAPVVAAVAVAAAALAYLKL